MFVTYDEKGLVTAYSDKARNALDIKEGEKEVEVDMGWEKISCKTGGLLFSEEKGALTNDGEIIAEAVKENIESNNVISE